MEIDLPQRYNTASDRELLDIVESEDGTYRPDVWTAARVELNRRGVSPRPQQELTALRKANQAARADEPLGFFLKLLSLSVFGFFLADHFKRTGYLRKASTARNLAILSLSPTLVTLTALILFFIFRSLK